MSVTAEVVLCFKRGGEVKENVEAQGFGSQWIYQPFKELNKDVEELISDFLSTVDFSNKEASSNTFKKTYLEYEYVILVSDGSF